MNLHIWTLLYMNNNCCSSQTKETLNLFAHQRHIISIRALKTICKKSVFILRKELHRLGMKLPLFLWGMEAFQGLAPSVCLRIKSPYITTSFLMRLSLFSCRFMLLFSEKTPKKLHHRLGLFFFYMSDPTRRAHRCGLTLRASVTNNM